MSPTAAAAASAAPTASPAAAGGAASTPNKLQYEPDGKPIEPEAPVRKIKRGAKSKEFKRLEEQHKNLMKRYRRELDRWNEEAGAT